MELIKVTGVPLFSDLPPDEIPHTLSYALIYRSRINSFSELPKDKRPPRNLWDKPYRLSEFFDKVFKTNEKDESETYLEYNSEDVE